MRILFVLLTKDQLKHLHINDSIFHARGNPIPPLLGYGKRTTGWTNKRDGEEMWEAGVKEINGERNISTTVKQLS
jgi:hypothetical protein